MEQYLPMSRLKQQQETSSTLGKAPFLELSSQLINEALTEALQDIEILTNTLFEIASKTKKMEANDDSKQGKENSSGIESDIRNLSQKALGQLQFADRMQQRLNNIGSNLKNLAKHPTCKDDTGNEEIWNDFLSEARKEFTMESEKTLFDQFFGEIKNDKNPQSNTNKDKKENLSNTQLF